MKYPLSNRASFISNSIELLIRPSWDRVFLYSCRIMLCMVNSYSSPIRGRLFLHLFFLFKNGAAKRKTVYTLYSIYLFLQLFRIYYSVAGYSNSSLLLLLCILVLFSLYITLFSILCSSPSSKESTTTLHDLVCLRDVFTFGWYLLR